MTQTKIFRFSSLIAITGLLMALLLPVMPAGALSATTLIPSDPRAGETGVTYTFDSAGFDTGTPIRCIDLFLNTQADGAGTAVGTTTGFTVGTSTAITDTSWTEDTAVNGRMRLTFAAGEAPAASGTIVYDGVTNGAAEGTTYYGIFTTYTDAGCSTPAAGTDSSIIAYVLKNGELVTLTIDPTLTFTCSPVIVGQTVNGATTTAASTASGIDHANSVTAAANGISAHDLNVATNAPGGYTVYVRHTGQLTNGASDTIDNLPVGTNAVPVAFTAVGTEAWGYTTEDATLAGGAATRFTAPGNFWAAFSTTNEPVIDNTSAPVGTETTRVGHQVGVASTTPAGTYQTTIIYTVASVY